MALVPFSSVDRTALRWLRTSEAPAEFTLLSGEAEVAKISWARVGGSLATCRTAEATWTLKRAGFLAPSILVRAAPDAPPVARLWAHLRSHEILVRDGPRYRLRHVSHLLPSWKLATDLGKEVLHVEPVAERGSLRGGAVLASEGRDRPEALLLVVLTWYFVVLSWLEDELIEALAPFEGPDAPVRLEGST